VINETSFVDESALTDESESTPQEKLPTSKVYAGTISQAGALSIKTQSVGKIMHLEKLQKQ
jgi:cation transport ATPase